MLAELGPSPSSFARVLLSLTTVLLAFVELTTFFPPREALAHSPLRCGG